MQRKEKNYDIHMGLQMATIAGRVAEISGGRIKVDRFNKTIVSWVWADSKPALCGNFNSKAELVDILIDVIADYLVAKARHDQERQIKALRKAIEVSKV